MWGKSPPLTPPQRLNRQVVIAEEEDEVPAEDVQEEERPVREAVPEEDVQDVEEEHEENPEEDEDTEDPDVEEDKQATFKATFRKSCDKNIKFIPYISNKNNYIFK